MTTIEFSTEFLPTLASSYLSGELGLHALVDFELWSKIFPNDPEHSGNCKWSNISFNAFQLNDDRQSLLLIYNIPQYNKPKEDKFVGIRIDNNNRQLLYYTLRRPKYNDEPWDICNYDFKSKKEIFLEKINGTDSLREFKQAIEKMPFSKPSPFVRIRSILIS